MTNKILNYCKENTEMLIQLNMLGATQHLKEKFPMATPIEISQAIGRWFIKEGWR